MSKQRKKAETKAEPFTFPEQLTAGQSAEFVAVIRQAIATEPLKLRSAEMKELKTKKGKKKVMKE